MDWTPEDALLCSCGRSFSKPGRLTQHRNTCKKAKRQFDNAFDTARRLWEQRKRLRVEGSNVRVSGTDQGPLHEENSAIPHGNTPPEV
jgi:hypothetical protein